MQEGKQSYLSLGAAGMLQDHFRQAPFALSDLHVVCNACKNQRVRHVVGDRGLSRAGNQWVNGVGPHHTFLGVLRCSVLLRLPIATQCYVFCVFFLASAGHAGPICNPPLPQIRAGGFHNSSRLR